MVCLQFVSRHDFAPARPGPQLAALSLITLSEGGVLGEGARGRVRRGGGGGGGEGGGGVHIRCALTSALAREASRGAISVCREQTAAVLRRPPAPRLGSSGCSSVHLL